VKPATITAEPAMMVPRTPILRIRMAGSFDEAPQNAPRKVKPRNAGPKAQPCSLIIAGSTTPSDEKVEAVIRNSSRLSAPSSSQDLHGIVVDMGVVPPSKLDPAPRSRDAGWGN
jgi:hypothetical protein